MEVDAPKADENKSKTSTGKDEASSKPEEKDEKSNAPKVTSFEPNTIRYLKVPYKISNFSRVLPNQANFVSFSKDERFVPIRKFRGAGGIIVLADTKPGEPVEIIKTVRQMNITEAPLPEPFTLSGEDLVDDIE